MTDTPEPKIDEDGIPRCTAPTCSRSVWIQTPFRFSYVCTVTDLDVNPKSDNTICEPAVSELRAIIRALTRALTLAVGQDAAAEALERAYKEAKDA